MTCKDCNHHLHNYHDKYVCTNKDSDCYGLNTDDDDSCALCESNWVRVEDRLPESGHSVLFWQGRDWYGIGWQVRGRWTDGEDYDIPVTHWMPLPEPPRD